MSVELILREEITGNDLISVYRAFGKAYSLEITKKDEDYLKTKGLEDLNSSFGIDYKSENNSRFIGTRTGDIFQFYGHNAPDDPKVLEKDKIFQNFVIKYFHNKSKFRKR
jgi:hypothetical protein